VERNTSLIDAQKIMGKNFIGPDELNCISEHMELMIPDPVPPIPFLMETLESCQENYILVLATSNWKNGNILNINSLRNHFGWNPAKYEPCFYNQDWYVKESFATQTILTHWLMVKKSVEDPLRGVDPANEILSRFEKKVFLKAVDAVYLFFVWNLARGEFLWSNDYVWCSDLDKNGDRIYIGKYSDPNGINKNGLEIHRHLRIRDNYSFVFNI
jgi:hypothetical protein